jgi:hypothetical protein
VREAGMDSAVSVRLEARRKSIYHRGKQMV